MWLPASSSVLLDGYSERVWNGYTRETRTTPNVQTKRRGHAQVRSDGLASKVLGLEVLNRHRNNSYCMRRITLPNRLG